MNQRYSPSYIQQFFRRARRMSPSRALALGQSLWSQILFGILVSYSSLQPEKVGRSSGSDFIPVFLVNTVVTGLDGAKGNTSSRPYITCRTLKGAGSEGASGPASRPFVCYGLYNRMQINSLVFTPLTHIVALGIAYTFFCVISVSS